MKIRSNVMAPLDLGGDLLRLLPGDNEVKPEVWAKVKDRKVTKALLACGDLVIVEGAPAPTPPQKTKEELEAEAKGSKPKGK